MSRLTYLRWIDEICQQLDTENVSMRAQEIEQIFKPLFALQLTPKQAIAQAWQQIHSYRLTKF